MSKQYEAWEEEFYKVFIGGDMRSAWDGAIELCIDYIKSRDTINHWDWDKEHKKDVYYITENEIRELLKFKS